MADTSANWDPKVQEGKLHEFLMEDSVHIYRGDGVEANAAGYALPMGDDANCMFLGVAIEEVDNTLTGHVQGGKRVRVQMGGNAVFLKATAAQTDVGLTAYASFDKTVVLSGASNPVIVGRVIEVPDATHVRVQLKLAENVTDTTHYGYATLCIPVQLATIANGNIVIGLPLKCAGEIVGFSFVTTVVASTADKLASLNLEIDGVNLTGGVIALTTAVCNVLGETTDSTAITGNNAFVSGGLLDIEAASTTAFIEGAGVLVITFRTLLQA